MKDGEPTPAEGPAARGVSGAQRGPAAGDRFHWTTEAEHAFVAFMEDGMSVQEAMECVRWE